MNTTEIQELLNTAERSIANVPTSFTRYLNKEIDWRDRLICIMGARGVGKTTLMRQRLKEAFGLGSDKDKQFRGRRRHRARNRQQDTAVALRFFILKEPRF